MASNNVLTVFTRIIPPGDAKAEALSSAALPEAAAATSPEPTPEVPKPKLETDLETLADAANEAAKHEAGQWFYFVTIMITLAALVGSTTHRVLLLEEPVKVPILSIELPLLGFYG